MAPTCPQLCAQPKRATVAVTGPKPRHPWLPCISLLPWLCRTQCQHRQRLAPSREHTWGKDPPHPYLMLHRSREVHQKTPREDKKSSEEPLLFPIATAGEPLSLQSRGSPKRKCSHVLAKPLSQHPEPCRGMAPASALGHSVSDKSSEQICSWPSKYLCLSNLGHIAQP